MSASPARFKPVLVGLLGLLLMAALLAWLMGVFTRRRPPGAEAPVAAAPPSVARHTVAAQRVPVTEPAVGTIRAVQETAVAARILGRVRTLAITRAGQSVKRGELLVELEAADLQAGLEQARAARKAAEAHRDKAKADFERTKELVASNVAAQARLDQDQAALAAAAADVERAVQAEAGAATALTFASVHAPIAGIVVDKKVNVGDVVQPGQVLCTLYDPTRLQLVAVVREELAGRLTVGDEVDVTLDALGKSCRGTVTEIVPEAQAKTRSFEVKVAGPCQPGIVTGMFGRLHVPLGSRDELRVPARAVASVGQLDLVYALRGERLERRYVRTGRRTGDDVEILAGLAPGEVIVADATTLSEALR